jgi:hypothetical protein
MPAKCFDLGAVEIVTALFVMTLSIANAKNHWKKKEDVISNTFVEEIPSKAMVICLKLA